MLPRGRTFEEIAEGFRWEIPGRLNMAAQVCDDWAALSGQPLVFAVIPFYLFRLL